MSCQWSRGFEWRARALGITLGKAAELAEEGGCKLIRLAARRTAERTAIRPLAWKKDEGERLRAAASSPLLRERVPDEVFGVRHVLDAYAVAAGEQHHAPREPEGPWPTSSPARALCWLAAAEQQVVFDERRDHRLPARSAHHWQVRVRWWRLPPPNATSEWTGDERAHCVAPKSPSRIFRPPRVFRLSDLSCSSHESRRPPP